MPQPTYNTTEVDAKVSALDTRVAALEASVTTLSNRVDVTVADIADIHTNITEVVARVAALEAGGTTPPIKPPDPPVPPSKTYVLNADFTSGGNAKLSNNQVLVDGKAQWQVFDNNNYGAGSGTKIQSWNKAANVTQDKNGLTIAAKMESKTISGNNYLASAGFLGTRDTSGADNNTKFPVPLWHEITASFTADAFVEDFDSIWLRHANGSSYGEFDLFETISAANYISGDNAYQYGVPNIGTPGTSNLWRANFHIPAGTRIEIVERLEQTSDGKALLTVKMNGLDPYQTVTTAGVTKPLVTTWTFDPKDLVRVTADKAHAFDIALQKHEGFDWGADVSKPYTGTLRNGSKGTPLGGNTKSWTDKGKTSTLTIHQIKVEAL